MKTLICVILSLLSLVFPFKGLKGYCAKLAENAYIISETNQNNKKSIAVKVFSETN